MSRSGSMMERGEPRQVGLGTNPFETLMFSRASINDSLVDWASSSWLKAIDICVSAFTKIGCTCIIASFPWASLEYQNSVHDDFVGSKDEY